MNVKTGGEDKERDHKRGIERILQGPLNQRSGCCPRCLKRVYVASAERVVRKKVMLKLWDTLRYVNILSIAVRKVMTRAM